MNNKEIKEKNIELLPQLIQLLKEAKIEIEDMSNYYSLVRKDKVLSYEDLIINKELTI